MIVCFLYVFCVCFLILCVGFDVKKRENSSGAPILAIGQGLWPDELPFLFLNICH